MDDPVSEKELLALYRMRKQDRERWKGRRRRQVEATPKTVGDLLSTAFSGQPDAARKMDEARALQAWPALVGECVARFSMAEKLRGDVLIVRVADPLWMQQLGFLKPELLQKLRASFPRLGVRDIYFVRG